MRDIRGEEYNLIKKAIDDLLKVNTSFKRKKKNALEKQKELFYSVINGLQALDVRSSLANADLRIDMSSYDELFYQVVDSLLLLMFGKDGYELINFYLYEKINPDGSINTLIDDNENEVVLDTPEDLWNVLSKLETFNSK
jgi:hypothetical protein